MQSFPPFSLMQPLPSLCPFHLKLKKSNLKEFQKRNRTLTVQLFNVFSLWDCFKYPGSQSSSFTLFLMGDRFVFERCKKSHMWIYNNQKFPKLILLWSFTPHILGQKSWKQTHRCYCNDLLIHSLWLPSESSQSSNQNHKYNRDWEISLNYFLCKVENTRNGAFCTKHWCFQQEELAAVVRLVCVLYCPRYSKFARVLPSRICSFCCLSLGFWYICAWALLLGFITDKSNLCIGCHQITTNLSSSRRFGDILLKTCFPAFSCSCFSSLLSVVRFHLSLPAIASLNRFSLSSLACLQCLLLSWSYRSYILLSQARRQSQKAARDHYLDLNNK